MINNCKKCKRYHFDITCKFKWRRKNTIEMGGNKHMMRPLTTYNKKGK